MTATSRLYIIVFFIGSFSIVIGMMGFDKVLKMIIGNYIITMIVIALGLVIDFEVSQIQANNLNILGFGATEVAKFLSDGKITLMIASYLGLMVIWYKFAQFSLTLRFDEMKKKGLLLLTTPLCVIGIVLSLVVILLGGNISDSGWILQHIPENEELRSFVMRIPLWIVIHGILMFILFLDINFISKYRYHSDNKYSDTRFSEYEE
ncbi:MAG: hypothetical protein CR971_02245 [candidate division SR1 bacterium]|nr:MAG: hypothetical protein CR971_02245 [candidate division SR1 bacterium]